MFEIVVKGPGNKLIERNIVIVTDLLNLLPHSDLILISELVQGLDITFVLKVLHCHLIFINIKVEHHFKQTNQVLGILNLVNWNPDIQFLDLLLEHHRQSCLAL